MKRPRYALARMPMHKETDDVLFDERDGRYIDGRTDPFPGICVKSMKEAHCLYEVINGSRVLDVGCGTGTLCNALALMGDSEYTAVDPSKKAISLCDKSGRVRFINCLSSDINETYDVVMSWHVLEHVEDPEAFVASLFRSCRAGGLVLIATPNASSVFAKSENWRCMETYHAYLIGKKMLADMARENGGRVLSHRTWGGFPAPRRLLQEAANKVAKYLGHGDVQLLVCKKAG